MTPLSAHPIERLSGACTVPGDKSISHRALMLAASAVGRSEIRGLLEGEDVLATARALGALGARIERRPDGVWLVWGRGTGGLTEPDDVLDLGNSGTGARLLMGLAASQPIRCIFTGDASLRARPMVRVIEPLSRFGARLEARGGGRLPLALRGAAEPVPITYRLPVASAQVKSAVLLAALNTPGRTSVVEPWPTRDHSERLLGHFGARVTRGRDDDGNDVVTIEGEPELTGRAVDVPGDPSAAAFPVVAAACVPGARFEIAGIAVNPTRTGLFACLREMGAALEFRNRREQAGEPVADLVVEGSDLLGIEVPATRAPSMIDEYPVLAVAAACAEGTTVMHGLGELRVKESDRLAAIAAGLAACGVDAEIGGDTLTVHGRGGRPPGGGFVEARHDHRIAMAFLVLGLGAERPVTIDDGRMIGTSFPDFVAQMTALGARIGPP